MREISPQSFTNKLKVSVLIVATWILATSVVESAEKPGNTSAVWLRPEVRERIGQRTGFKLGSCTNVTLDVTQFTYDNVTRELNVTVGYQPITISDYAMSSDASAATVCYPLSPQLLSCEVLVASNETGRDRSAGGFRVDSRHTLHHDELNETVLLGDYYLDDNGRAIWCRETVDTQQKKTPTRCNLIIVTTADDLRQNVDGNWILYGGDVVFRQPSITGQANEDNASFPVCYPLSVAFLNCPLKIVLEVQQYELLDNHSVRDLVIGGVVGPADYFRLDEEIVVCGLNYVNRGIGDSTIDHVLAFDIFIGFYVLSAVCMLLAVAYHLQVPKPNYHTRCHTSYAISMFVMYVGMALRKLIPLMSAPSCYVLYAVTYLSTLGCFFWLNVMAFDVWQFFSSLQTSRLRCFVGTDATNRFQRYSLFAWGMPLLLFVLSMAVDRIRSLQKIFWLFPGIESQCWFNERPSNWAFFYGPLVVLMVLNLVFYAVTVVNIHHASKGTDLVNERRVRQLLKISLKLFMVMGLCWISDIVTFVVTTGSHFNYYWYVSGVLTGLQGVAICLIYIIRRQNIQHIRGHLCPSRQISRESWSSFPGRAKMAVSKTDSRMSDVTTVSASSSQPSDVGVDFSRDVTADDMEPPDYDTVEKSDL